MAGHQYWEGTQQVIGTLKGHGRLPSKRDCTRTGTRQVARNRKIINIRNAHGQGVALGSIDTMKNDGIFRFHPLGLAGYPGEHRVIPSYTHSMQVWETLV